MALPIKREFFLLSVATITLVHSHTYCQASLFRHQINLVLLSADA